MRIHSLPEMYQRKTTTDPDHTSRYPQRDPRLSEVSTPVSSQDDQGLAELEALNKELLAELALSSSETVTPTLEERQSDYKLEDHPKDWLIIDSIKNTFWGL